MSATFDGRIHAPANPETLGVCNPQHLVGASAARTVTLPTGSRVPVTGPHNGTSDVVAHTNLEPSYQKKAQIATATEPIVKHQVAAVVQGGRLSVTNLKEGLPITLQKMYVRKVYIRFDVQQMQTTAASPVPNLTTSGLRVHNGLGYRLIRSLSVTTGGCGVTIDPPGFMTNFGAGDQLLMALRSGLPLEHNAEASDLERGGYYRDNMDEKLRGLVMSPRTLWVDISDLFGNLDLKGEDLGGMTFNMEYWQNIMDFVIAEGGYVGITETNFAAAPYFLSALPAVSDPQLIIEFGQAIAPDARVLLSERSIPEAVFRDHFAAADTTAHTVNLPSTTNTVSAVVLKRLEAANGDPYGPQRGFNPHLNIREVSSITGQLYQGFTATLTTGGVRRAEAGGDTDDTHRRHRSHAVQVAGNIVRLGHGVYAEHGDIDKEHAQLSAPVLGVLQSGTGTALTVQNAATGAAASHTRIEVPASVFLMMTLKIVRFALAAGSNGQSVWTATPARIFSQ